MKRIVSICLGSSRRDYHIHTTLLGQRIELRRIGTDGDVARAAVLVREHDGRVDAIGLGGLTPVFRVGEARYPHSEAVRIAAAARRTPVLDGGGIRAMLEPWAVDEAERLLCGVFGQRRALVTSGLEHYPLAQALVRHGAELRFGDPVFRFRLPFLPAPRTLARLEFYAAAILPIAALLPYRLLHPSRLAKEGRRPRAALFRWADVLAGDFASIRRFAPLDLRGKLVLTDDPSPEEVADLRERGVAALVTMTPPLCRERPFVAADVLEAMAAAVMECGGPPLAADLLEFVDAAGWQPTVHHLAPVGKEVRQK
ncbi:MAG TPA: hypothetical protein VFS21_10440 [Roseiflexaceae bacterium]|nr:hypothetical protein [Roseiflexaceae bacterium]